MKKSIYLEISAVYLQFCCKLRSGDKTAAEMSYSFFFGFIAMFPYKLVCEAGGRRYVQFMLKLMRVFFMFALAISITEADDCNNL